MPEPAEILSLHDAWTAAVTDLAAIEARVAQELADARARVKAANAAYAAGMHAAGLPEGEPFSVVPPAAPLVVLKGDEVVLRTPHFLGQPYTPEA